MVIKILGWATLGMLAAILLSGVKCNTSNTISKIEVVAEGNVIKSDEEVAASYVIATVNVPERTRGTLRDIQIGDTTIPLTIGTSFREFHEAVAAAGGTLDVRSEGATLVLPNSLALTTLTIRVEDDKIRLIKVTSVADTRAVDITDALVTQEKLLGLATYQARNGNRLQAVWSGRATAFTILDIVIQGEIATLELTVVGGTTDGNILLGGYKSTGDAYNSIKGGKQI
jgi:hypothetical protein